jgi:anti-anti-sigma regulatory factor
LVPQVLTHITLAEHWLSPILNTRLLKSLQEPLMSTSATSRLFEFDEVGGITILRFTRPDPRGCSLSGQFSESVDQLVSSGRTKFVVSFAGVEAVSSVLIALLLRLDRTLKGLGGGLALSNLSPDLVEVLVACQVRQHFSIYDFEREAIESLASAS